MPSFDIVSEIDMHELSNALDQTNKEISNRFDFKGTNSKVERADTTLTLISSSEFQIKQMINILEIKLAKREIDIRCLEYGPIQESNNETRQTVTIRQGIDKELARKLVKMIKEMKIKVQAAIQGEQVRITGKKRDELQEVISTLKSSKIDTPLQFNNFRD